jgi:hypothetical protein
LSELIVERPFSTDILDVRVDREELICPRTILIFGQFADGFELPVLHFVVLVAPKSLCIELIVETLFTIVDC